MVKPTTNQRVLNAAYKHLSTMTKQSMDYGANCVYLNEDDGNMCGIGGILPKSLLKEAHVIELFHPLGVANLMSQNLEINSYFKNVEDDLLVKVQTCHDERDNWGQKGMLKRELNTIFNRIAEVHKLRSPV